MGDTTRGKEPLGIGRVSSEQETLGSVEAPRVPVSGTFHGVTVTEDYRWLEDASSDRTRRWTQRQDRRTRGYLSALPVYRDVLARVEQVLGAESVDYSSLRVAGDRVFALKTEPRGQQPLLVVLSDVDDESTERVVVDPYRLDSSGGTAIDFYAPSPDGSLVVVSLSQHGSEHGAAHVFETGSGHLVGEVVPRVQGGAAGSVAWKADSSGFWYTRHPSPGERPEEHLSFFQEVWFHRMGQPVDNDRADLADGFADPRVAESLLTASPDGQWVLDRVQRGDSGEWQVFVRAQSGGQWWQVADIDQGVVDAAFGSESTLYLVSRREAPRGRVLRVELRPGTTVEDADEVVPETDIWLGGPTLTMNLEGGLAATDSHLWVVGVDGGPSVLRRFDPDGARMRQIRTGENDSVTGLCRVGPHEVAYATESVVQPRAWWCVSGTEAPRPTPLRGQAPIDVSQFAVRRDVATSADGTRVPITVVGMRGAGRDGSSPLLLTGYGGYGLSFQPPYRPKWLPWLEQGWVVAVAHVRGGGEYGEQWHKEGRLAAKQNCFDDFSACARHLVDTGLTSPERLAIEGKSNGGLLVGAVLTQHPDLARAVVAKVPLMDMLRAERSPNGVYNIPEFGSVEDPDMFPVLLAYSPYHNVIDGMAYPAVLLTAGEYDPRVDAWHAKKMAARLQAATSSDRAVLLRVEASGHGAGTARQPTIGEQADVYTFLIDQLDLRYKPVTSGT